MKVPKSILTLTCLGLLVLVPFILFEHDTARLHDQPYATMATWDEVRAFILQDKTDEIPYTQRFKCTDYAVMVHNNAERAGIEAEYLSLKPGLNHVINAFNTTDRGWVYIDCTRGDWLVITLEPLRCTQMRLRYGLSPIVIEAFYGVAAFELLEGKE